MNPEERSTSRSRGRRRRSSRGGRRRGGQRRGPGRTPETEIRDERPERDEREAESSGRDDRERDDRGRGPTRGGGRRRRQRPIPEDVALTDELADGHERNVDPREVGAEIATDHAIDLADVDEDAIKVLRRLARHDFQSYLVGGCVRDLLIGQHPKDFDIATSATPRQIRDLFRNSRVIGRRFRLVHIHFGSHILEVSTFRSLAPSPDDDDDPMIRRDNVFGRADEDARRRDFTINGLFFDIEKNEVIDFVGGLADLERRRIEIIGDPETRLREDPVRMLRAAKFAGRLDFTIADDLWEAIEDCRDDLRKCPAPRLWEELQRMLGRGGAERSVSILHDTGILEVLLPELDRWLEDDEDDGVDIDMTPATRFWRSLAVLDEFSHRRVDVPSFTKIAVMFSHLFAPALHHQGPVPRGAAAARYNVGLLVDELLAPIALRLQVPRRDLYLIKQSLVALRRFLAHRAGKRKPSVGQMVRKEWFPEGFRLFQIYARACNRWQDEVLRWEEAWERAHGRPFD